MAAAPRLNLYSSWRPARQTYWSEGKEADVSDHEAAQESCMNIPVSLLINRGQITLHHSYYIFVWGPEDGYWGIDTDYCAGMHPFIP